MAKKVNQHLKNETPVFDLKAFGEKAKWTDFYIQDLKNHIAEHEFIEKPHKHDFYLILFVSHGDGRHTIDFVDYAVGAHSIFLMTPGQVHSWSLSDDVHGFVIFFTRDFYQMRLSESSLLEFPFFHSLTAAPLIQLAKDDVVDFALRKMHYEYNAAPQPDLRILRAYLDVLLLDVAKYYKASARPQTTANTYKLRRLEQLIEENFRRLKQPSDYGELMNIAPSYLNSICKQELGKTLSQLIHQRILLEAKRLFAYSDFNINEVASKLNFSDTSYFVRWFKKQTQLTPDEFRKSPGAAAD